MVPHTTASQTNLALPFSCFKLSAQKAFDWQTHAQKTSSPKVKLKPQR